MKRYELTYLLSPDLSEKEFQETSEIIKSLILNEEGEVEEIKKPIRKSWAILLKKEVNPF